MQTYVVVGGGLAGHRACVRLRELSAGCQIALLSDESHLPYDRPPLSKDFVLSSGEPVPYLLKSAADYVDRRIDFYPDTHVSAIDRDNRLVRSRDGRVFHYDRLLLATGSRVRELPFAKPSSRIHYLRTLDDALRIRSRLREGARNIAIIGAGFIGLEVASAAAQLGCGVTVIENRSRVLSRGMPEPVSSYFEHLHRRNGVDMHLGREVVDVDEGEDGVRIQLTDHRLEADIALVAVGVVPNLELAANAGLEVSDGILVDRSCRTSDPSIFAAGEVTAFPAAPDGSIRRVESWRVAADQPVVAANVMTGSTDSFDDLPWLWSDQFDVNMQSIGAADGPDQRVVLGDGPDSWTLLNSSPDGHLIGAVSINRGRDISLIRRRLSAGRCLSADIFPGARPVEDLLPNIRVP